jgi:hypothetical protein
MLKIAPLRKKRYPARGARKKQFPINLPRLANWPVHRVQELTPLAWQAAKASATA